MKIPKLKLPEHEPETWQVKKLELAVMLTEQNKQTIALLKEIRNELKLIRENLIGDA